MNTDRPSSDRLTSLDALRGFDMFWIIGGREIAVLGSGWLDWGREPVWRQFQHVPWEGFTFYDLIFPLFLFLVGAVLPFSIGKAKQAGASVHARILRRTAILFTLGLVYNHALDLSAANFRLMGVLQRIALAYGVAALLVAHVNVRTQALVAGGILLGYWALLANVGDFTPAGCLPGMIDRSVLPGKLVAYEYGDNEGLLSTLPAIATALLGALAGSWLKSSSSPWTKVAGLALAGVACVVVGDVWGRWFPIIKNIWTSSYVLYAGGWSLLLLTLFYLVIDVLGFRKWSFFFVVIGVNAITIYVVRRVFLYRFIAKPLVLDGSPPETVWPLLLAIGVVAAEWLFLWGLYRAKLYLRV